MHELMISEEECHHTVRRGNFFAIRAMLPELQPATDAKPAGLTKEFSSEDTVIGFEETVELLRRHNLLMGQSEAADGIELFEAAAGKRAA